MLIHDTPGSQTGKPKFVCPEHMIVRDDRPAVNTANRTPPSLANESLTSSESQTPKIQVDGAEPLARSDDSESRLASATCVVRKLLSEVKEDCGAPFETEAIEALAIIRHRTPAEYRRIRAELKKANRDVSITALEDAIQAHAALKNAAQTHHGYASDSIRHLTLGSWVPRAHEGSLYVVDQNLGLWVSHPPGALERMVAETHDGKQNCERRSDYNGIAQHIMTLATDDQFFRDAPVGLACPGGFYQVLNGAITVQPLRPTHRQRVMLDVTPCQQETPIFTRFLHETFESSNAGEEEQQLVRVQEIAGATMLGTMYRYQKAVLFQEPFGRAGKGTLERVIRRLVPPEFVTAVSPFVWDKEYYVASLAGARLNVVGELPDELPIPAAAFKSVIGGDLLTGRHPTHRPISFKNEAAHLFMSNHLINTRDHSEAFFSRWLLVEFPNSRLRTGQPLDDTLADRMIAQELTGIAQWALEGALRLVRQGAFSKSAAHDRLMAQWRRSTSSLQEFIHESCQTGDKTYAVLRSKFYVEYTSWCGQNGRRPFAKARVRDLLEHNIGLGISLVTVNGYETFRGVQIKANLDVDEGVY